MESQAKKRATPPRTSSLKSKNAVYLWSFIGVNLAIFFSIIAAKALTASSIELSWHRVTTKDGIIAAAVPLLTVVLSGVLGDSAKARLVFWRWHNPLPGCRAFSDLAHNDPRINITALKDKVGRFPRDPISQNALWYSLYKKHSGELTVSEAHRMYLLTRDMTAISALFTLLFSCGVVGASINWHTAIPYVGGLVLQYVLIARAAQNYGSRFVLNVLTVVSHS